jgi:hypothetical protein
MRLNLISSNRSSINALSMKRASLDINGQYNRASGRFGHVFDSTNLNSVSSRDIAVRDKSWIFPSETPVGWSSFSGKLIDSSEGWINIGEKSHYKFIEFQQSLRESMKIARLLVHLNDALPVLLMLADNTEVRANEIPEQLALGNDFLEVITELRRLDLLIVKDQMVHITTKGRKVVENLRMAVKRDVVNAKQPLPK